MILDRYLLRQFFPIFFIVISMFVLLFILIDLFANLIRYLNNEVAIKTILQISLFYIPKSISYALPISLLFAAAYTLGELYAKNELTCIFSTGIPFWRFSVSLLMVGFIISILSFYFDEKIVMPTLKTKNALSRRALNLHVTENNSEIVVITKNGRLIYSVDYFDYDRMVINGVSIIESDENGRFVSHIRSPSAEWKETHWEFKNAVIYENENNIIKDRMLPETTAYDEHPDIFRRSSVIYQELPAKEARLHVNDLRDAGFPFFEAQANYFHRYSFSATSFVVMILSITMGGRFKKNILLMSLFTSLIAAVVFYVIEMLSMTMARLSIIHPLIGAWFPVLLFVFIGILLLRSVRT
ncbi:MAG: LptF/LptG family permease [Treponema sp.]|nr:LptF/LptG family permease [Treponema sp.]